MTILVTGGMGYIGSHTCVELLNRGLDVVIVDNLVNSSMESIKRVQAITGKTPVFYDLDVRDEEKLSRVFEEHQIDCVMHFAGLKAVGESVAKPALYYDNNLNSTITLCRVMAKYGVKRIIFSSSATVYSGDNEMPLTEASKTGNCTNPYGWTKYFGEQILRDIAKADPEWSVVLLRYFNPVGAHESGTIGEDPKGIPNNLMPFISQVAVGRRDHLSVFGNDYPTPDGTCLRDYIDITDLAKVHVCAVSRMINGEMKKDYEIFNVGTGRPLSVMELVTIFEKVNGVKVNHKITSRRPGDVCAVWCDPSLAEKELGWKACRPIEDTLRSAWEWQKHLESK